MRELDFLESLFDKKLVGILRIFFQFNSKKFYLKEVADAAKVSMATTHRILTKLVKLGILDEIKISKFKVYQLAQNEKTEFLSSFIKESVKVLEVFIEAISSDPAIETIILVGKESDSKANVLIIGENVDAEKIKIAASDIKDQYNYKITYITMPQQQYDQMSSMGLYPGTKKTVYQK
jgi:DNA-binding Lrp family transcriptional regulator